MIDTPENPDAAYFSLLETDSDPRRIKKEREKARKLKKTHWWLNQLTLGICHFCQQKFAARFLTLDHLVPLARGGASKRGNVVVACRSCNQSKKLAIPVEEILSDLQAQARKQAGE